MHYTDTLAQRLRAMADELESAERYGLPMPGSAVVTQSAGFHTSDPEVFAQWVDYLEVEPKPLGDSQFVQVETDVNGLLFNVTTTVQPDAVVA